MEQKDSNEITLNSKLLVSDDGLVRLTYEDFVNIQIIHLYSELNVDVTLANEISNGQTLLCGLTEWNSDGILPVLSIGWSWKFDPLNGSADYEIDGQPFSNIMFIDDIHEKDKGKEETTNILIKCIDQMDWCEQVKKYLNWKYS